MKTLPLSVLSVLLLAACSTEYQRPAAPVAATWLNAQAAAPQVAGWETRFQDPRL